MKLWKMKFLRLLSVVSKIKKSMGHRRLCHTVFLLYFFMAHYVIPQWNDGRDVFVLSKWDLFSFSVRKAVADITCGNKNQFLLRDNYQRVRHSSIDHNHIFRQLRKLDARGLRDSEKNKIKELCGKSNLKVITFKGNYVDFYLEKKSLPVIQETPL